MSADDAREALAAMVREGEAAGMYADDHGSAGFCTDHGQPAAHPTTVAEAVEATGPWTCAHCGATGEGPEPHCVQLARIINGYDRTPAEQRAADADAEVERLREVVGRIADHLWSISADEAHLDVVADLRAALAAAPSETRRPWAETFHDEHPHLADGQCVTGYDETTYNTRPAPTDPKEDDCG